MLRAAHAVIRDSFSLPFATAWSALSANTVLTSPPPQVDTSLREFVLFYVLLHPLEPSSWQASLIVTQPPYLPNFPSFLVS